MEYRLLSRSGLKIPMIRLGTGIFGPKKYGLARYVVYQGYDSLVSRDYLWELSLSVARSLQSGSGQTEFDERNFQPTPWQLDTTNS